MQKLTNVLLILIIVTLTSIAGAQPQKATQPTEVIGTICKTVDKHPAPTPEANYDIMDYAVCGEGGLRVYPSQTTSEDFMDLKKGVQGKKQGREVVYLSGYTRTTVLPSFGPRSASQPRFRFTWLEVEKIDRDIDFVKRLRVKKAGEMAHIEMTIVNPLNKPIKRITAELDMKGRKYFAPYTQMIPVIGPRGEYTIRFDVPRHGTPHGTITVKNYGRVYIDIERSF